MWLKNILLITSVLTLISKILYQNNPVRVVAE